MTKKTIKEESTLPEPNQFPKPEAYPSTKEKPCCCKSIEYAVKIVSGNPVNTVTPAGIIAAGQYYTDVNIHNPSTCNAVTFKWCVSIAVEISSGSSLPNMPWHKFTLRPGQSIEIDSPDIFRATNGRSFTKGFVLIETQCELDVVAVYTAAANAKSTVVAFHTERVPARHVDSCCDDLVHNISTGVANWMLIAATDLTGTSLMNSGDLPCQAAVVDNSNINPNWAPAPAGTKWISVDHFSKTNPPGFYTFQTCFTLCSGFENAYLQFSMMHDNEATVWFNGSQINGIFTTNFWNAPDHIIIPAGLFLPGLNCLTVVVKNDTGGSTNPMGLNILDTNPGFIIANHGACEDGCCCGG